MFSFELQDEDVRLVKDDLFNIGQTAEDLLVMKPADCESYSEQVQKEKEFLFIPSRLTGMKIVLNLFLPGFCIACHPLIFWKILYQVDNTEIFNCCAPTLIIQLRLCLKKSYKMD